MQVLKYGIGVEVALDTEFNAAALGEFSRLPKLKVNNLANNTGGLASELVSSSTG